MAALAMVHFTWALIWATGCTRSTAQFTATDHFATANIREGMGIGMTAPATITTRHITIAGIIHTTRVATGPVTHGAIIATAVIAISITSAVTGIGIEA